MAQIIRSCNKPMWHGVHIRLPGALRSFKRLMSLSICSSIYVTPVTNRQRRVRRRDSRLDDSVTRSRRWSKGADRRKEWAGGGGGRPTEGSLGAMRTQPLFLRGSAAAVRLCPVQTNTVIGSTAPETSGTKDCIRLTQNILAHLQVRSEAWSLSKKASVF